MPFSILGKETAHMDAQSVLSAIDQLLSLNGWVAALCPTLNRPFGQNKYEDAYDDLARDDHLYYIAIVIHSADHFLVDQLAVIVQMAKRLGGANIFVSMLDYGSSDSTETLTDLCEAVLTLLSVPFRIRRVPAMTEDPAAAYYPLEEAHMRNLALEPLRELYQRRNVKFHRVIWLKGFTCPNDILETIRVSIANEAAMVCGMDWAEHNGYFIFSDRWVAYNRPVLRDIDSWPVGELGTSRAISSVNPGRPQNQTQFPLVIKLVQPDMPNTFHSKSSAVNRAHTSLTQNNHTTKALHIVQETISITLALSIQQCTEIRMPLV
jgi:hypothetical protein